VLERSFYNYDLWRKGQARLHHLLPGHERWAAITLTDHPGDRDNALSLHHRRRTHDFADANTYYNVSTVKLPRCRRLPVQRQRRNHLGHWTRSSRTRSSMSRDVVIDYIKRWGRYRLSMRAGCAPEGRLSVAHQRLSRKTCSLTRAGVVDPPTFLSGQPDPHRDGAVNVALLDAGDIFFGGAPISALLLGESAIDIYNMIATTWPASAITSLTRAQALLQTRITQSTFPMSVRISSWREPSGIRPPGLKPYEILTLGSGRRRSSLASIGLTTDETPNVTLRGKTDGLSSRT